MVKALKAVLLGTFFFLCLHVPSSLGGQDGASVPAGLVPWSGYWWPTSKGELALGYNGHPSPMEKYDAYESGYWPSNATAEELERGYDPSALPWEGLCDDWAAASVLEEEPKSSGYRKGIKFQVGDKKGLLTRYYDDNYVIVMYGTRYNNEGDDLQDIYPGGENGFHKVLIHYIKELGLPVIADLDAGPQVWNHPIYRYEMTWWDEGDKRHVTCTVWLVDYAEPDFVGTKVFSKTYNYWLKIDPWGNVMDDPGGWEGASVNDHPDFLWFPTFIGGGSFLDDNAIRDILSASASYEEDIFEDNDSRDEAYEVPILDRNRYYAAIAVDKDCFKVALGEGDDFIAQVLSNVENFPMAAFDPSGLEVGHRIGNALLIDEITSPGYHTVCIGPIDTEPFYNVRFYRSHRLFIPHLDWANGWNTDVCLMKTDTAWHGLRVGVFSEGRMTQSESLDLRQGELWCKSVEELFPQNVEEGEWLKIVALGDEPVVCRFDYEREGLYASIPCCFEGEKSLYLPHLPKEGWWTGVALSNSHPLNTAHVLVRAYDGIGQPIASLEIQIPPQDKWVGLIEDLLPGIAHEVAWLEFNSDESVCGLFLYGTDRGLVGMPLIGNDRLGSVLYLPHVVVNGGWWTGLALCNPGDEGVHIILHGFDGDGEEVASRSLNIDGKGNWVGFIQEAFGIDWTDEIKWVEVEADDIIGGLWVIGHDVGSVIGLPLESPYSVRTDLLLDGMDLAGGNIGLVMLNPNGHKTDVWVEPYNANGERLLPEGEYLWYNPPWGLPPKGKVAGWIEEVLPGIPEGTAYIRIHSEEPLAAFIFLEKEVNLEEIDAIPMK